MADNESRTKILIAVLLCECVVLFLCWRGAELNFRMNSEGFEQGKGLNWSRQGFSQGKGLNWSRQGFGNRQGFEQGKGLKWADGFLQKPLLSERTPQQNRGLNDLEISNGMLGRSRDHRRERTVSSFWRAEAPIQLSANQAKTEGMADGDESQYTRDRDNMGSDIDSTLNELTTQDNLSRLTCNDACPSVSGMNRKWTDTAKDMATPLYGGYGAYNAV